MVAYELAAPRVEQVREAQAKIIVAGDSARSIWRGGQGLREMGGGRGARHYSAGEFWHGASDRRAAISQLAIDFKTFQHDLSSGDLSDRDREWVATVCTPTFESWAAFAGTENASALAAAMTEWSVFESWWERLRRLRELARARHIQLESPEPVRLPRTVWERAATGTGSDADVWISALKTGILGAMAIVGAASLYSIVRDFKKAV